MIDIFDCDYKDLKSLFVKSLLDSIITYSTKTNETDTFYIDFNSKINKSGSDINLIGNMLYPHISYLDVSSIGGVPSLNPLLVSTLIAWGYNKRVGSEHINVFETTCNDNDIWEIVGPVNPNDSVVLVHDVVKTCEKVDKLLSSCENYGLNVLKLIVLVDMVEDVDCFIELKSKYSKIIIESIVSVNELKILYNVANY